MERRQTGRPRTVTQQDAHHGQIAHKMKFHLIRNVVYEYSQVRDFLWLIQSYLAGLFPQAGHNIMAKWLHQLQASCLYSRQEEREKDRNHQLYFVIFWEKQKTSQKPQHTLVIAHWSERDHMAPLASRRMETQVPHLGLILLTKSGFNQQERRGNLYWACN